MVHYLLVFSHSLLRWGILFLFLPVLWRSIKGVRNRSPYQTIDAQLRLALVSLLDFQLLIGLALFWVSPFTERGERGMVHVMREPLLRFWTVEHPSTMFLAIVFAHLGKIFIKRTSQDEVRQQRTLVFFGIAFVLMMAGIPWPGTQWGRPLSPLSIS
ncbi:hypothetical protein [Pajaroellobacter abortibovis]|uniref:Cytochrome b561 bacterial/Ni-hydrogenase domain-containing protein n=1 Tax=Pajaroellobacter abortibovis TaxID=1882918 RepID=A0A1L6MW75_9BACT|nr:hypothetical protein [Pajaroellobacter abortibovis]APR99724.1 hypothetical protein BCY86_02825 [Pajaroellobacter abortibovis]